MELNAHAIRRARLPAHLGRRAGVRGTLERWLAALDLSRYGLPPNAIVLVRELRAGWAQVAGPAGSVRHDALGMVLSGALRPAHERGPMAATSAVWFADEAELLACMARDALAGPLSARWWWPTLLRGEADRAAALRHWIASARAVPRAAECLSAMGLGAPWFELWDAPARGALLLALARHHPVSAAAQHFVEAGPSEAGAGLRGGAARAEMPAGLRPGRAQQGDAAASVPAGQSARQRLHRLCLNLARDPVCAIDERYVEREAQRESAPSAAEGHRFSNRSSDDVLSRQPRVAAVAALETSPSGSVTLPSAACVEVAERPVAGVCAADARIAAQAEGPRDPAEARAAGAQPDGTSRHGLAHETPTTASRARQPAVAVRSTATAQAALDIPIRIDTQHGGLFFVLNAALQMGLYGDFTQPLHRGLVMSPWRFLIEVGRAFGGRRFARDPLADWLKATEGARARAGSEADPGSGDAEALVQVLQVLPGLRARLVLALGMRDARRLAGALLRLPARVQASPDRIDVHFELQQLPLSVRLAGLDRDPGWIPAAGRDLRFHFE